MKKRLLGLVSLFALASCGETVSNPLESSQIISSGDSASISVAPTETYKEVKDPTEGLLYLESGLRPVFANDKQGFKVKEIDNKPLIAFSFKSKEDITLGETQSEDAELMDYTIKLYDENAKIEFFNCTKKDGFKSRSTFDKANLVVNCDDDDVLSLKQTYKFYLDETEITDPDTSRKTTVKGAYLDLSKAKLSKTIIANILDSSNITDYSYFEIGTLFTIIDYFLPLSDALTRLLPSFMDFLKNRIASPYGSLKATKDEHFWLSASIRDKDELTTLLMDMIDDSFGSNLAERLIKVLVKEAVALYLEKIESFSMNFDIFFEEGEVDSINFGANMKPAYDSEDIDSSSFVGGGFEFNMGLTLLSGNEIDQTTYPNNLTDRNIWKEVTYTSFL